MQFQQRVRRIFHPRPGKTIIMVELVTPYVHYFNRGVNKEAIFFSNDGYDYLLRLVFRFLPYYPIELVAYCLMPNHYHLLLKVDTLLDGSRYIQRVFNACTQGVNKQVGRVGTLFQGNVKKRFIENDDYLRETIKYIHLNPLKSDLVQRAEEWKFSDYREWIGLQQSSRSVSQNCISLFGSMVDYKNWLQAEIS